MKQWPLNKAYFWETAPFFRILLPFIAGIICYDAGLGFPPHWALMLFIATAIFFVFVGFRTQGKAVGFTSVQLALAVSGWILSYYQDIRNDANWFGNKITNAQAFTAILEKNPQEKEKTYKLEVSIAGALDDQLLTSVKGKALVYIYKEQEPIALKAGDTVLIPNNWQPIKNAGNPFEFDYARYCRRNNVFYQQFLSTDDLVKHNSAAPPDITYWGKAHDYCIKTLGSYIQDTATLGIIQAMLVGDEANFDTGLRQAYAETGVIHVIAISGSHLTVFFFLIAFLLSWIRNKKHQWIKYAVALPLIWLYVVMAGAPPSAVRAAAMFSLLAIGLMLQKGSNSLNQLLATAFILLCAKPMWLFSVGFQLSFIAVLSLILFYSPIYKLYTPPNPIARLLWATTAASIAAELLVAPLVVYYFHIFPVLFIFANIVAYCFMGAVLVLGMAIILFSFIAPVASFLALACTFLTRIFNVIILAFQELNPEPFKYLQLSGAETLLLYALIACFAIYLIQKAKPALFTALTATSLLLALLCYDEWAALHQERLVVYNMSRSSHIELIRGTQHQVLFTDTAIGPEKKNYVLNPAHIVWRALDKDSAAFRSTLLQIGNKSALLLNEPMHPSHPIDIDYLILNYPIHTTDITQLQRIYKPKLIIQSGHISRKVAEQCEQIADSSHINLHTTVLDGAYVIDAL